MKGNTFLGTIVAKSSIKDQFLPLETRNSEQLVPLLAIDDHFAFQEGTVPESRKGTALKNKMCSKTSLVKKEKSKKRLIDHFVEHNRMPKFTGRNKTLAWKTGNKIEI